MDADAFVDVAGRRTDGRAQRPHGGELAVAAAETETAWTQRGAEGSAYGEPGCMCRVRPVHPVRVLALEVEPPRH